MKRYYPRLMLPNMLPNTLYFATLEQINIGETREYAGKFLIANMPLLKGIVHNNSDFIVTELCVGKDEDKYIFINGRCYGLVSVICQRCLEKFEIEINSEFSLSPVYAHTRIELPVQYEPVELKEGKIDLNKLVSEEILLNLPMIPMHEPLVCKGKKWLEENNKQINSYDQPDNRVNPFEVLKKIK